MKKHQRITEIAICALLALTFTGFVFLMTGCNTVSGIARDLESISDGTKEHLINH